MSATIGAARVELSINSAKFEAQMKRAEAAVGKFKNSLNQTQRKFRSYGRKMERIGSSLQRNVSLPLLAIGGASLKAAADFESAFTGVQKTVDATEKEYAQLRSQILALSKEIPASASEIAGVVEVAGQLGVRGVGNLMKFTRTAIDMGNSTNVAANDAATAMARIDEIMGGNQKTFDRLGSSIVEVGNNFATTEDRILDASQRLAGIGKVAGLTQSQIVGIAGAVTSTSDRVESASTAISKTISKMTSAVSTGGRELEMIAKIAGMTAQEFQQKFRTDAAGALADFIEGLERTRQSGADVFTILDRLGLSGERVAQNILSLAGANTTLRDAIASSGEAWQKNTALTEEAQKRYKDFWQWLKKVRNRITTVAIKVGNKLRPAVEQMVKLVEDLVMGFDKLNPALQSFIMNISALGIVVPGLLTALGVMVGSVIPAMITGYTTLYTAVIPALTKAVYALNAAFMTNPIAASLWAATTAAVALDGAMQEAGERQARLNKEISKMEEVDLENASYSELETQLVDVKSKLQDIRDNGRPLAWIPYLGADYDEIQRLEKLLGQTRDRLNEMKPTGMMKSSGMIFEEMGLDMNALAGKGGPYIFKPTIRVKPKVERNGDSGGGGGVSEAVSNIMAEMQSKIQQLETKLTMPDIFPDADAVKGKIDIWKSAIVDLVNEGVNPASSAFQTLRSKIQGALSPANLPGKEFYQNLGSNNFGLSQQDISVSGDSGIDTITKKFASLKDQVKATAAAYFENIDGMIAKGAEFSSGVEAALSGTQSKWQSFKDKFKAIGGDMKAFLAGEISSAVLSFGEALGKSLSGAENSWQTTFEKIMIIVLDFAASLAKMAAAIGGVMLFIPGMQGAGAGLLAAAAVLQAVSSGVKAGIEKRASNRQKRNDERAKAQENAKKTSVPALAKGGMLTGPSLILAGDNPNAKVDPEVVAPLSTLEGMMGSGGGMSEEWFVDALETALSRVRWKQRGTDLVAVIEQTKSRTQR